MYLHVLVGWKPCRAMMFKSFASSRAANKNIFFAFCPTNLIVPLEERAYLGDQRLKAGPKGSFQMASVDRAAVKNLPASE